MSAPAPALETRAVRSFLWAGASFATHKLIAFVGTLVLARILVPADFGLVAAALTLLTLCEMALDLGVGATVVYEQETGRSDRVQTAFTLSLAMGIGLTVVGVLAAPLVAGFFQAPGETALFRAMALYLLLRSAGQVPDAVLRRDLAYRKRLWAELARAMTRVAIAIPLALAGYGAWSIVLGMLVGELVGTTITFVVARFRPALCFDRAALTSLLHFGVAMVGVRVVAEIAINADYLIVGNQLGPDQLGIYSVAYRIPELVIASVFWIFSSVAFPIFSQARTHGGTVLRTGFLRSLRIGTLFAFPAAAGVALVADDAIRVLFTDRWEGAIVPMSLVALALGLASVTRIGGDVLPAVGRPRTLFLVNLAATVPMVAGMIWATRYGLVGVASAHLLGIAGHVVLHQVMVNRAVETRWRDVFVAVRPGVVTAIAVVAVAWPTHQLLEPGALRLLATIVAGLLGGLIGLVAGGRAALPELRQLASAAGRS
jgi:lipopolysaccharide exporter